MRAEIASLHLRRNERAEAEKAAKAALALDEKNVEANRALGLIYAAAVDASERAAQTTQTATYVRDAITHLERAAAGRRSRPMQSCSSRWALVHPRGLSGQSGAVADARPQPESRTRCEGAWRWRRPMRRQGLEERDRDARRDCRGRAARGVRAGAVPGGRGSADGRGRELHARAGRAAGKPRPEGPTHCGAARSEGVRPRGRLRRRSAQAASERARSSRGCRAARSSMPATEAAGSRCSSRR